ncbi:MAG: 30S ribosomal protein S1 [Armatimonadota bacterium]
MSNDITELDDVTPVEGGIADGEGASHDYDRVWDTLATAQQEQNIISAMVVDAVKGGLVIDLGVRGFIPKSQIATRNLNNLERYIGQTLEVKVVDVDREHGRVVLSERKADDEKRAALRAETLSRLQRDMVVDGVVRRLTDFGAFVDIGGIDGLLHVSDMSWEHVDKPADVVQEGETVTVKVLRIENDGARISLGLKQLQEDPWNAARRELREDNLIEVTIDSVTPTGAVAKVMRGVDGFIPIKEFPSRHGEEGAEAPTTVEAGQTVMVKVLEVRARERRLLLSIRQAARERERQETRDFMKRQRSEENATPTLGDLFGDVFNKLKTKE